MISSRRQSDMRVTLFKAALRHVTGEDEGRLHSTPCHLLHSAPSETTA
jgi:hypothetical protein